MRTWATAGAAALLATGCGLVLDLAPPDPSVMGEMDAGRLDAGRLDAAVDMDAGPRDGGRNDQGDGQVIVFDGGPSPDANVTGPDGGPLEDCESACTAPGFYCQRPDGRCIGPAHCVPIPPLSPACAIDPVCGCDRKTYSNTCAARSAGVNVASAGECPDYAMFDWCDQPEPEGPTSCHPCFDEADCLDIPFTTDWTCVGSACAPGGEGSCQPSATGRCYYDGECNADQFCEAPEIRVCVGSEFLTQGTCRRR